MALKYRDKRKLAWGGAMGIGMLVLLWVTLGSYDSHGATEESHEPPVTSQPRPIPTASVVSNGKAVSLVQPYVNKLRRGSEQSTLSGGSRAGKAGMLFVLPVLDVAPGRTSHTAQQIAAAHPNADVLLIVDHHVQLDLRDVSVISFPRKSFSLPRAIEVYRSQHGIPDVVGVFSGAADPDAMASFLSAAEGRLQDPSVLAVGCKVSDGSLIRAFGLSPAIRDGEHVQIYPRLEGFSLLDSRSQTPIHSYLLPASCAVFRGEDLVMHAPVRDANDETASVSETAGIFEGTVWDTIMALRQARPTANAVVLPMAIKVSEEAIKAFQPALHSPPSAAELHIGSLYPLELLEAVHAGRHHMLEAVLPDAVSFLGTTIMWDTFCSCTGVNIEAISYLVALEQFIHTRAVASPDCWCQGFPDAVMRALDRLVQPKGLDRGVLAVVPETSRLVLWVSHKPPDFYPTFPYKGVITWRSRPDYVIGRSMIEVDGIPSDWAAKFSSGAVDELWVPSEFLIPVFAKAGVPASMVHVIPEAIDVHLYDPTITQPDPTVKRNGRFVYLSNFKWEDRKGWDVLLTAFFKTFTADDPVSLVLKTYLYMDPDSHNEAKIRDRVLSFAKSRGFNVSRLPHFQVLAGETPASLMPALYKAADCFVLPTRGEGWGLPMHEAMAMALPTIATGWGGSTHFMHPWNSLPVRVKGTEPAPGWPSGSRWAVPDVDDLMEKMRWVRDNPDEARELGRRARAHIVANFSQEAVVPIILRRVAEIKQKLEGR